MAGRVADLLHDPADLLGVGLGLDLSDRRAHPVTKDELCHLNRELAAKVIPGVVPKLVRMPAMVLAPLLQLLPAFFTKPGLPFPFGLPAHPLFPGDLRPLQFPRRRESFVASALDGSSVRRHVVMVGWPALPVILAIVPWPIAAG